MLLSERIRTQLADEITSAQLPPGSSLDEMQLATRFKASRTPVREALRQLIASGLAESGARRGVIVARMFPERVMDMFETMAEIEATCVRMATYRMTPLERGHLNALHISSEVMVRSRDFEAYDSFNREFHQFIYAATHNGFLAELAFSTRDRLAAFRRTQLREGDRIARSHEEHHEVIVAIAECDGEKAARRMRAHMLNAANALAQFIAANGVGVPATG